MTRISYIFQDMKCQYIYDVIDHYSYSNQIYVEKKRTNERVIFMRTLDYCFGKRAVNILSHIEKKVKSNDVDVIIDKWTDDGCIYIYIYIKELSSH
jgi:hypothetical protein